MGLSKERVQALCRIEDFMREGKTSCALEELKRLTDVATAAERERLMEDPCSWHEDEDGVWWTGCDNAFTLETGTPSENEMQFCCYCGRRLDDHLRLHPEAGEGG